MTPESPSSAASESAIRRARVVLNEPVGLLDYRVPPTLLDELRPGMAVRVPLGRRRTGAYVTSIEVGPHPRGIELKDLQGIDAERPPLPTPVMSLLLFAADYYGVTPGEMLSAALPAIARPVGAKYRLTQAGRDHFTTLQNATGSRAEAERAVLEVASRFPKGFTVAALERDLAISRSSGQSRLKRAADKGWLERVHRQHGVKMETTVMRLADGEPGALSARQTKAAALLAHIPAAGGVAMATLQGIDNKARARVRTLEKAGLVTCVHTPVRHVPYPLERADAAGTADRLSPTAAQNAVIEAIGVAVAAQAYQTFLLQGVTGSGKTEVYLQVIERALQMGRTALVLVPEIALTPQLGERFRRRFGERVATFHSGLTAAERRDEWERVAAGRATIGLGARSALFLPLERVGIVIVDEEHETSFKQDETPRYNARDLAVLRAQKEGAVVVLGSATPSLESYTNAKNGRYERLLLPDRVHDRPLPAVELIPLAGAARVGDGAFTERLALDLERVLSAGEQAILFLNRRGFAPYIFCRDCGHTYRCDDCDVSLTLHRRRDVLLCHYCDATMPAPDTCSSCHGHRVDSYGLGTEKVEAEVRALFGDMPIVRLDRDTVRKKADLERALGRFRGGEAQLLIGTQMVAKGHDFPGVTLVGVVAADASLNFPDFRAAERTFQLLTQVAGRAGRGEKPGHVLVQTYETEHYAIRAAQTHDYEGFVEQELMHRAELGYPPFSRLVLLRFEGESQSRTQESAQKSAQELRARATAEGFEVQVLGPAEAPIGRLRGFYRVHVLLKGKDRAHLRRILQALSRPTANVRRILDVDPINML